MSALKRSHETHYEPTAEEKTDYQKKRMRLGRDETRLCRNADEASGVNEEQLGKAYWEAENEVEMTQIVREITSNEESNLDSEQFEVLQELKNTSLEIQRESDEAKAADNRRDPTRLIVCLSGSNNPAAEGDEANQMPFKHSDAGFQEGISRSSCVDEERRISARSYDKKAKKINELEQELEHCGRKIESLGDRILTMNDTVQHYQTSVRALELTIEKEHARYVKVLGEKDLYKRRNEELRIRNRELNATLNTKLKGIQDHLLQSQDQQSWAAPEDAKITKDIKTTGRAIKSFVASTMYLKPELLPSDFLGRASAESCQFVTSAGQEFLTEGMMDKRTLVIWLAAWITTMIHNNIFRQPLNLLQYLRKVEDTQHVTGSESSVTFPLTLVSKYYGVTSAEFIKLRSDIFRYLEPTVGGIQANEKVAELELRAQQARVLAADDLALRILNKVERFRKPGPREEALKKLSGIIVKLFAVYTSITAQRCRIKRVTAAMLDKEDPRRRGKMTDLEYHEVHERDIDDMDEVLQGKAILMLTHPIIYAVGASDGSDVTSERLLRNGVAWMGPPDLLRAEASKVLDSARPNSGSRVPPTMFFEGENVSIADKDPESSQ